MITKLKKNRGCGMVLTKMSKTSRDQKKVNFSYEAADAHEVMLAGDFNNWDYKSTPLKKDKDKVWKKSITLKPGRYEYKFVVDGNWVADPNNSNKSCNSFGTENSVLEI